MQIFSSFIRKEEEHSNEVKKLNIEKLERDERIMEQSKEVCFRLLWDLLSLFQLYRPYLWRIMTLLGKHVATCAHCIPFVNLQIEVLKDELEAAKEAAQRAPSKTMKHLVERLRNQLALKEKQQKVD